jgi:hypothetical protein
MPTSGTAARRRNHFGLSRPPACRGERDTAQATLTKAAGLADSLVIKGPTLNAQWPERLMAAVLVREAKALVEPKRDK